jgi:glycine/D-amino acid oxidase-like deaminating enzyme
MVKCDIAIVGGFAGASLAYKLSKLETVTIRGEF